MKNRKGFTLIELLAVIVILAILMLIAIPSVTTYIGNSRKEAFVDNAKGVVRGAVNIVNSGKFGNYDPTVTYYIPAVCFKNEYGGDRSAFGVEWDKQFVVVTYDGDDGFTFYYTSLDKAGNGIYLTYSNDLRSELVKNGITDLPINITVGEREKIIYFTDECNPNKFTETYNVRYLVDDKLSYDEENVTNIFQLKQYCTFNGKDGVITGEGCKEYNGQKFIDSGLQLFSQKNAGKDFQISFDIVEFDSTKQDPGVLQCTLMANKLESGIYPGFAFRFSGTKWEFTQRINNNKLVITKPEGTVKSIKVVRWKNVLYYAFDNDPLTKFQDMDEFHEYFDSTLYIGAAQDKDFNPFRFATGTIENLVIRMGSIKFADIDTGLKTVLEIEGPCTFNGKTGTITGENCTAYAGQKYIDTGLSLYSEENYKKNFSISFYIDEFDPDNQDSDNDMPTIMCSKQESGNAQGLVLRNTGTNIEISQKINKKKVGNSTSAKGLKSFKVYRSNGSIYYSYNNGTVHKLQDGADFNQFFDDTLIFGAARDGSGQIFRNSKMTLSKIVVRMSD